MATDWSKLWQELNDRQQAYLKLIYELDQENEDYYKNRWSVYKQGYPPPASEWRWILYGPAYPTAKLEQQLKSRQLVDQGTGSTFESLEERRYIERKWEGDGLLYVQMTRRGRRVMRETSRPEQFSRCRDIDKPEEGTHTETKFVSYAQITEAGTAFYEANREAYEQLYGRIEF